MATKTLKKGTPVVVMPKQGPSFAAVVAFDPGMGIQRVWVKREGREFAVERFSIVEGR